MRAEQINTGRGQSGRAYGITIHAGAAYRHVLFLRTAPAHTHKKKKKKKKRNTPFCVSVNLPTHTHTPNKRASIKDRPSRSERRARD